MKKNKQLMIIGGIVVISGGAYLYSIGYFDKLGMDKNILAISEELGKNTFAFINQLNINEANYVSTMTIVLNREILLKFNTNVHISYVLENIKRILKSNAVLSYYKFDKIKTSQKDYEKNIGAFLYLLVKELVENDKVTFTRK